MRITRSSKAGAFSAMAGLLICGMASQATAANLLLNAGFESPAAPGTATAWTFIGDTSKQVFANHTGNTDPLAKATPAGYSVWIKSFVAQTGKAQQDVNITPGATYAFSTWAWFEANYPTLTTKPPADPGDPTSLPVAGIDLTVGIDWLDAGGTSLGVPSTRLIDTDDPTAFGPGPAFNTGTYSVTKWNNITFNAAAPAGASKARVFGTWTGGGGSGQQISAFLDDFVIDGPGAPAAASWGVATSGDWNVGDNWNTGTVPNGVGVEANLGTIITSPQTVYSNTAITVGTLRFSNPNTYVLSGAGSLTMDVASGSALLEVTGGSHKINLPLRLNDSTTANVANGTTLIIADPLTLANGSVLTKAGLGTLEIISTTTTIGAISTISTSAGTTNLRIGMTGGNTALASTGGTTRTFTSQRVSSVNVSGGTLAIDSTGGDRAIVTDSLTVAAGKLDVGDNGLIVRYTGTSPAPAIRAALASGRTGGNGIVTTAAATGPGGLGARGVGYALNTQLTVPTQTFLGEAFTGTAVLVRYTLIGDSNLDTAVNFDDLVSLAQNYLGGTGKQWYQGDFDYDSDVDFDDLVSLAQNYNGALLTGDQFGAAFAADWALAQSLVPEPTSLAAIGGIATMALRRRR